MKTGIKIVNIITIMSVLLSVIFTNTTVGSAAKGDDSGFIKVAGAIGLKSDGSIWSIPQDDGQKYAKISDGYMDIDTDRMESSYIALKKDGTVWVWGKNTMGQFAENTLKESDKPIKIMDNVMAISGLSALKKDGSVWVWGGRVFLEKESKVNKPMFLYGGVKSIAYGSNCIYIIDKKSTLYGIRNYYNGYDMGKGVNKIKIADNVKFVTNNHYITNDNNLWKIYITENEEDEDSETSSYSYSFIPKLILTNVVYANSNNDSGSMNQSGTSCAIKADGSLWVWDMDYMIYGSKLNTVLPQKLMTGVKYAKCGYKNIQIIKNDGTISVCGTKLPKSTYSMPAVLSKDVSKVYDDFSMILKKDDTLMWIPSKFNNQRNDVIVKNASKNVIWNSNGAIINRPDGEKWEFIFDNESGTYRISRYDFDCKMKSDRIYVKDDNTVWRVDYNIYGDTVHNKINIDGSKIKKIYTNYSNNIYMIYNDDTLWISVGRPVETKEGDTVNYQPPVKLLDNVKELEFHEHNIFVITNDGVLYGCPSDYYVQDVKAKDFMKILDGVEKFDSKTKMFDVIKKDKSHWNLSSEALELSENNEEFQNAILQNAYKDIDNIEGFLSYEQDFYITANSELWVRGYGDDAFTSYFGEEIKLNFSKVMDNVVYAEHDNGRGLAICKDGSLWEYGPVIIQEIGEDLIIINEDIKPRKIMDNVKEAHIKKGVCAALKKDGSLYTWGYNVSGQVGNGTTEFSEKPQKILDNVEKFLIYQYGMYALNKSGTLFGWGAGFHPMDTKPFVDNPIRIASSDSKILHNNYEAVGLEENIPIQVKINDPSFDKEVRLIIENGHEIILDKTNSGNFAGLIPGINKTGVLKYYIMASDGKGNSIKSDGYQVQIISNERVIADINNGEFVQSDMEVIIDGKGMDSGFRPLIKSGRTLVPVRALAEALKADVNWDGETQSVNISKSGKNMVFKIGSREVAVNNEKVSIDVPAIIVNAQTLLPLRAVCELLGADVAIDAENEKIIIKSVR